MDRQIFYSIKLQLHSHLRLSNIYSGARSSDQRRSIEKCVLRNFEKFTGKHLRQGFFFKKSQGFIKKEALAQVFSCEF